ncbi:hypothetical protein TYRP_006659 [Tyrophagus putrescentiae]|nr:hypothetical protein TYRP_006659 [Tyrophagus putrescentiae]
MPSAHFRVLPPPSSSSKVDDEDDRGSKSLKYNGQKLLISGNGAPNISVRCSLWYTRQQKHSK